MKTRSVVWASWIALGLSHNATWQHCLFQYGVFVLSSFCLLKLPAFCISEGSQANQRCSNSLLSASLKAAKQTKDAHTKPHGEKKGFMTLAL